MKTRHIISILVIISLHGTAQIPQPISMTNYPSFYTQIVNKLNNIIPNKTVYYNQPLSVLLQTLSQNNLTIKAYDPVPYNNRYLKLMFIDDAETNSERRKNGYVAPYIDIYFKQPYNYQQASAIINQYHWFWNSTAENFYKNLLIEKIEFWYVRGLTDKSMDPK
ncbi:hypothetical protein [Chryseobacterium salviniae]|uniref:Uncharacterized protein n=1 Tax=Chryseobacterium salviniae TaxID=3101750 RepID=A0ABU6HWI7_9FLAO|nr:hypothetical protein [Chryseobacterium sp. T9W2-O]MEC3877430.1 hypothetical protein [Chryseobacterium sp. T9W2-O]